MKNSSKKSSSKIALCQMKVVGNKEKNIEKAIELIKSAKSKGAELAILGEMFNCPYENKKFIEYAEICSDGQSPTLNEIAKTAKELGIWIIAGSIPEKTISNLSNKEKIYNTSFVFNDKGELVAKHRKIHLFDIDIKGKIRFMESDTLSSGRDITVFNSPFGKIGLCICYDIRFMELSRLMALEGADIIVIPGAFNLTTGPLHWELLFRARAVDNQIFTIGVAPALNKESSYHSYGNSIAVNPWGEIIAKADYNEEVVIVDLDLNEVEKIREEIPVMKNRREDVYELKEILGDR
ncbi:MAG: carbon-nitrogen hydrolase family protein [Methanobacteriaceae archaeon]